MAARRAACVAQRTDRAMLRIADSPGKPDATYRD